MRGSKTYKSKEETVNAVLEHVKTYGHFNTTDVSSTLYGAVRRYFGDIKAMRSELGIAKIAKKGRTITAEERCKRSESSRKYSGEEMAREIQALVSAGYTRTEMRKVNPSIISAIGRSHGSLQKFADTHGIELPVRASKYTDDELEAFLRKNHRTGVNYNQAKHSLGRESRSMVGACCRRWGSYNKALEFFGLQPYMTMSRFSTADEVANRYLQDLRKGVMRGDISYRNAILKHFGSIEALNNYVGIDNSPGKCIEILEIDEIDSLIFTLIKTKPERITYDTLNAFNERLGISIKKHYGTIKQYFSQLDVDLLGETRLPFIWTPNNIKRQLERWIREGKPVNYTYVARNHKGILDAARKFFGGWGNVFSACGLDYEDYRTDTAMASFQGRLFENLVNEILLASGMEFDREPEINGCHPDFVIGNHWIDAKLSEWTVSTSDCVTIPKYDPHCNNLTIVYLRGCESTERLTGNCTRIIPVDIFVDELLEGRQKDRFIRKIADMRVRIEREIA